MLADMEHLLISSTIIRAHPCAACASKKSAGKWVKRHGEVVEASLPKFIIECFISKIKHYRRVFSRFEKSSKNLDKSDEIIKTTTIKQPSICPGGKSLYLKAWTGKWNREDLLRIMSQKSN